MKHLPAWTGWPGTGPAPGHEWLPRSFLRSVTLFLAYAFLALSLTVNYAASTTFFLLAIIGMYVGFRRGFANGLTRTEKFVMIIFAAYPAVAIISYVFGTQTNAGFRFLGRDLRFLLFIPIYIGIRWSRPRSHHVGWALAGGALGACIMAMIQYQPWPAPTPRGVTGTHITFGDLSILSGFLSAALLWPWATKEDSTHTSTWTRRVGAGVGLLAGILTGILASARGGWLAIPILLLLFLWLSPIGARFLCIHRLTLSLFSVALLVAVTWLVPSIHHQISRTRKNLMAYLTVANSKTINAPCVDSKAFLRTLMHYSYARGPGQTSIVRLPAADQRAVRAFGCQGSYALRLSYVGRGEKPFQLNLYRGNATAQHQLQLGAVLARGSGAFDVGWGQWVRIESPRSWQVYRTTRRSSRIRPLIVLTSAHTSLWLIPLQIPQGYYAYALAKSSTGERLEMWRAAWALFLQHPWLGGGTGAFHPLGEEALGTSAMEPIVGDYEHAHSDYLTSLGTKGSIGFLSLLLVLAGPWLALHREKDAWPLAGAVFTGGMAVCAVTETLLVHSLVLSWFTMAMAALLTAAMAEELPRG